MLAQLLSKANDMYYLWLDHGEGLPQPRGEWLPDAPIRTGLRVRDFAYGTVHHLTLDSVGRGEEITGILLGSGDSSDVQCLGPLRESSVRYRARGSNPRDGWQRDAGTGAA